MALPGFAMPGYTDEIDLLHDDVVRDLNPDGGVVVSLRSPPPRVIDPLSMGVFLPVATVPSQSITADRHDGVPTTLRLDGRVQRVMVVRYGIRKADLTIGTPVAGWRLADGDRLRQIVEVQEDPSGRWLWLETVRATSGDRDSAGGE